MRGTASRVRSGDRVMPMGGEIPGLPRNSNLAVFSVPNVGRPPNSFREPPPPPMQQQRREMNGRGVAATRPEPPRVLQGSGSRETWINPFNYGESSQEVNLYTDGRPLVAEVESWEGPSNTPTRMRVYSEDGRLRPFRAHVDSTSYGGSSSSVSVRNTGNMAFPIQANVYAEPRSSVVKRGLATATGTTIQGNGSLRTFPVDLTVGSVLVELESQGMPIQAVIELWQGPGQARQVAEIYVEDGQRRPCSCVIDTPSGFGGGSTVAIRNVGPMEFPFSARVTPYRPQANMNRPQPMMEERGYAGQNDYGYGRGAPDRMMSSGRDGRRLAQPNDMGTNREYNRNQYFQGPLNYSNDAYSTSYIDNAARARARGGHRTSSSEFFSVS